MTTKPNLIHLNIDIVFCIEVTNIMFGRLNNVKTNMLKLLQSINKDVKQWGKHIDKYRIKVIAFRDFDWDRENALEILDFVELPEKQEEFLSFVDKLRAKGGKTGKSNGLEALALAMDSDWNKDGDRHRHIIVVYASSPTYHLEKDSENKPRGLPISFDALTNWWEGVGGKMEGEAKRLILFAPDTESWSDISTYWESTIHYPSSAGIGLSENDLETITDGIVLNEMR